MRPRGKKRNNAPSANDQLFYIEQNVTKRYSLESNNYIKQIEKYSLHWVLRPASVKAVEVAKLISGR